MDIFDFKFEFYGKNTLKIVYSEVSTRLTTYFKIGSFWARLTRKYHLKLETYLESKHVMPLLWTLSITPGIHGIVWIFVFFAWQGIFGVGQSTAKVYNKETSVKVRFK